METLRTLPGDDVRQIMWRYADRFDVVANQVTITPERQAKYDLSQPYSVSEGVIVTRADDNSVHSLDDIRGRTAGQNVTSEWGEVAKAHGIGIGFAPAAFPGVVVFARRAAGGGTWPGSSGSSCQSPPAGIRSVFVLIVFMGVAAEPVDSCRARKPSTRLTADAMSAKDSWSPSSSRHSA